LQIVAAGQIDCVFVPSLEAFGTGDVALVRDVLIEIDVFLQILLFRMHVLPAGEHDLTAHEPAACSDKVAVEAHRQPVSHLLDRAVAGVGVDGRPRQDQAAYLAREPGCIHRRHPPALAQSDEMHGRSEIIDDDVDLSQVRVDVIVLHLGGGALPVHHQDAIVSGCAQGFDETLSLGVVDNG
jgi:hypothetical protein